MKTIFQPLNRRRVIRATAAFSLLVGLALVLPAYGQMSPEEHASHHPGQAAGAPPAGGAGAPRDRIRLAIATVDRDQERERIIAAAVKANVRRSVRQRRQVPSIAAAIKTKNIKVEVAMYHIDLGKVTFLNE